MNIEQIKREVFANMPNEDVCVANKTIDYLHSCGYLGGAPEWQPIETAPEDISVLAYWKHHKIMDVAIFDFNGWNIDGLSCTPPTHWMPLPAAPKGDK